MSGSPLERGQHQQGRPEHRARILYVDLAPAVGGSVISLYHLMKGLDRGSYEPHVILRASNDYAARFRGLGVNVVTIGGGDAVSSDVVAENWAGLRQSRLAKWLKRSALGEKIVHLVGFFLRTYPGLRREARTLGEILETIKPDLVHLNDVVCLSRAGIMAARKAGVPAICHLRTMAERNYFDRRLSRSLLGYICISHAVDHHQRTLGGRVAPSWVVYNGLDLGEFASSSGGNDGAKIREELGLAEQNQVVGCIGRLVAWKGQHVFLRALAKLVPDYPQLRGLIIGAAEAYGQRYEQYPRELEELNRDLGLEQVVTFAGFRRDVPRLLRGMDVLVHASTSPEPFGRVIIEGMAAGTSVVGTDAGAVPEIIQDKVTGLLVPPGDVEAMARAIAYVLGHPRQREAMCLMAGRAVEAKFTASHYVKGIERVYACLQARQKGILS